MLTLETTFPQDKSLATYDIVDIRRLKDAMQMVQVGVLLIGFQCVYPVISHY